MASSHLHRLFNRTVFHAPPFGRAFSIEPSLTKTPLTYKDIPIIRRALLASIRTSFDVRRFLQLTPRVTPKRLLKATDAKPLKRLIQPPITGKRAVASHNIEQESFSIHFLRQDSACEAIATRAIHSGTDAELIEWLQCILLVFDHEIDLDPLVSIPSLLSAIYSRSHSVPREYNPFCAPIEPPNKF